MEMNNNTDRYFRDRLAEFEQSPPDSNWDAIAQKMSKGKKKLSAMLLFRIAAGMALITSLGIGIYFINQPETSGSRKEITEHNSKPEASAKENAEKSSVSSVLKNKRPVHQSSEFQKYTQSKAESTLQKKPSLREIPEHSSEIASVVPNPTTENIEMNPLASLDIPRAMNQLPEIDFSASYEKSLSQEEAVALLMAEYNAGFAEEIAEKKTNRRWELGGEVAPLYSDRTINSSSLESSAINNLNDKEDGIMAYAGGLRVSFSPARRLSVQSGVYYSRYGQKKNEALIYNELATALVSNKIVSVTNSTGTITMKDQGTSRSVMNKSLNDAGMNEIMTQPLFNGSSSDEVTIKQTFDYFELPLVLKYKMIDRKLDFSLSGGIITNFLIGNKVDMTQNGRNRLIGKTTQINEVNYVGSVGLGIEYPLIPRFALTLEPRFRYYLNTIDQSSQISVHPYSFGFFAGVNYTF